MVSGHQLGTVCLKTVLLKDDNTPQFSIFSTFTHFSGLASHGVLRLEVSMDDLSPPFYTQAALSALTTLFLFSPPYDTINFSKSHVIVNNNYHFLNSSFRFKAENKFKRRNFNFKD